MSNKPVEKKVQLFVYMCDWCEKELKDYDAPRAAGERMDFISIERPDPSSKTGYKTLDFHKACVINMYEVAGAK